MTETPPTTDHDATWSRTCSDLAESHAALCTAARELEKLAPSAADRGPAWELYVELRTRISVASLRYRDGDEVAALDSLHKLFVRTRELISEHGREAPAFASLAITLLEVLRPFTGFWHGRKEKGALQRQDEMRRFRRELRSLVRPLEACCRPLEVLAGTSLKRAEPGHAPHLDTGALWPDTPLGPTSSDASGFRISDELEWIAARRRQAFEDPDEQECGGLGPSESGATLGLVGLSLSGGGIRSATFCLGVLQCLQRHGVLRDVDYLSTVSGGGYLGTFLSTRLWADRAQTTKRSYDAVLDDLLARPSDRSGDTRPVRWLRNNSKYLLSNTWKERRDTAAHFLRGLLPWGPSLHELYRDRLCRAYVDDGTPRGRSAPKLSQLTENPSRAPYHLLNAAVNLPSSRNIDLRGRRSDFFVLSPLWTGSTVTGYCPTSDLEDAMEKRRERFDLSTAMAVSGAAVAPHMGTGSPGVLVRAVLVAANARLSHWLPNPKQLENGGAPSRWKTMGSRWRELRGDFDEEDAFVHLSDGGHIENLGLYELLRRRCKLILAVDGECDPQRGAGALVKLTRLAFIDLGVRIDIDHSALRMDSEGYSRTHWAFGTIHYGSGDDGRPEVGYLVYLKSSLTGNEPDYVLQYRREHPSFPHQTTADQLFDEEQFEAYRALGEHVASDLFGEDLISEEDLRSAGFRSRRWLESLVREFL